MDVKTEVGSCAGEVYQFLEKQSSRQARVMELVKDIGKDNRIVIASLGWLLREDKIDITSDGQKMIVKLK